MGRRTFIALVALTALGTLLGGAQARSKPRVPVAPPVERLVLGAADTPGLAPRRASVAAGQRAIARAMRPARLPKLGGVAIASRFASGGAELWSLAYTQKSAAAASSRATSVVNALRRAGLRPTRTDVGAAGWAVTKQGSALVVWHRRNAVGELLLTTKLDPRLLTTIATQYAAVADAHMEHLLSLDAWERTLERIKPDGTVPRAVALDLFALAYGPLPGTKRPAGPYGRISEGTLAARVVLRSWSTLTPAQQAAAARALGITSVRLGKKPSWRVTEAAHSRADYGDPTFKPDAGLTEEIETWLRIYVQKLTPKPKLKLKVVAGTSQEKSNAWADTLTVDIDGNVTKDSPFCRVRLLPVGQAEKNADFRELALAHEAFHCIQDDVMGAENALLVNRRDWLLEGSADWAAISIRRPIGWDVAGGNLEEYFNTPRTPLFSRVYDAVGFFGHAELMVGDLWPRMIAILREKTSLGSYTAAGGIGVTFLNSWGSSTFNRPKVGFDWYSTTPLATPPDFLPSGSVPIWSDVELVDAGPYALARYIIDGEVGLAKKKPLLHVQIKGFARLGNISLDTIDLEDAWFWLGPGFARCPPGTQGTPPPARPLGQRGALLALTGGLFGAAGTVSFESLETYCKQKQKPPEKPRGGPAGGGGGGSGNSGGGGGSSFSDPHLVTFDAGWYDFQGAGEYTLARSRSGDLDVQVREEPLSESSPIGRAIAINTAVAMRVAGDRVGVYTPGLTVRVNGRGFVPTRRARRLAHGGSVRTVDGEIEVRWPDGSLVRVMAVFGLGVLVQPAAARQGTLQGLFGNFDTNPKNDFVTRSGKLLDPDEVPRSYRLLYHVFGDSWRIAQRQSLFDYARGESTRTFTKRSLPHRLTAVDLLSPRQLKMARRICRALHITKPEVFRACLFDVGLTGDGAFATSSAQAERTAGGFPAPKKAGKRAKPAKPSKATTTWSRMSAKATGAISLELDGGKVVAAYVTSSGAAEALTFTPSTTRDAVGARRNAITSGWSSLGDPILVERPGGLQVLLRGIHGGLGDPLNGVSFAQRRADGSFGAPVLAATSTYAEFAVGKAVSAPDGAPLWAANRGGTLWLWRGATGAVGADLSGLTGGPAGVASVGRDRAGRYWLAWQTVFAAQAQRNGLYLQQFDPQTLKTIGSPQRAPRSSAVGYSGQVPLACRTTCRLVYFQSTKAGLKIVSWAPGERGVTTVVAARAGHSLSQVATAYSASGRLWVAWWDNAGSAGFGYRAVLGNAKGGGGSSFSVGRPTDAGGAAVAVTAVGSNLMLVTVSKGPSPYVNVVAPR
jgi:von Willebrand factor type D domain